MFLRSLISMLGALALVGCASAGSSEIAAGDLPAPDPVTIASLSTTAEYRVGPMDTLDISVFQVPELSREAQVDAQGMVNMPLIGAVPAAGHTTVELEREIATRLSEKYLQAPQVNISVKEFASQRVTVDGAVMAPGVYPVTGPTTLMRAVAMAKGADPRFANERQVVIFRTVNGQRMAARFDLAAIRAGEADDPEVYGNDIIVVDRSGARSVLRDVVGALPVISIFRPLIF